ncbi:hypothetical protein BKA70DRAFT_1430592 [Coprinopsis sp. MPI-PUGE-AT-0042]|nr:hypothetical protein BKA70DRAFT_1430592 [Coprinopsis sp. MPI-PUGE-AT-0042]
MIPSPIVTRGRARNHPTASKEVDTANVNEGILVSDEPHRFDVASDAEGAIGIGLSLLQNLADGKDADDEDGGECSGSGGIASNRASNARSIHAGTASTECSPGVGGRFSATPVNSPGHSTTTFGSPGYGVASDGHAIAVGGGGLTRQDSTASTIAGLRCGSGSSEDEDDEDETFAVPSTGTFPMPPTRMFPISPPVSSPPSATSMLQQLSPTSRQFPHPSRPIPQRSQSYSSLLSQKSQESLSLTGLIFPAPNHARILHPRLTPPPVFSSPSSRSSTRPPTERRPSNALPLAPSLAASTASWEGDIYDDYRYSRYSTTSLSAAGAGEIELAKSHPFPNGMTVAAKAQDVAWTANTLE